MLASALTYGTDARTAAGLAASLCLVALVAAVAVVWALVRRRRQKVLETRLPPVAVVINLASQPHRLDAFKDAYGLSDLRGVVDLLRVDAFDGGAVDWSRFVTPRALEQLLTAQRTGARPAHPDLTPGAVGRYLSHLEAWRVIAETGAPFGFVFEDTAQLPREVLRRFRHLHGQLPFNWDVALLGYEGAGAHFGPDVVRVDRGFRGLHAYAISGAAAQRLTAACLPIEQRLDLTLSALAGSGGLAMFGAFPSFVGVQDTRTLDTLAEEVEDAGMPAPRNQRTESWGASGPKI